MRKIIVVLALCWAGLCANARDFKVAGVFSDSMVLQQQTLAPVWGWADEGDKVTVATGWDGEKYSCVTGADGRWEVKVATPAAGGPYTLTVSMKKEKVTFNDVMVGEVWLCSGQSNMDMPLKGYLSQSPEGSLEAILGAGAYDDMIRVYTIHTDKAFEPVEDVPYVWKRTTEEVAANMSGIGYFFARNLTRALGVPVGIIQNPWGGCNLEPWLSMEYFDEAVKGKIPEDTYQYLLDRKDEPNTDRSPLQISTMYNARMYPVAGYALKGFLWYQGCGNLGGYGFYDKLQQGMVKCWRDMWGDSENELPFFFTTLAPFGYGDSQGGTRALFVENQLASLDLIPNSGAAVGESLGDEGCIHPAKKREIADQFTLMALEKTYGKKTGISCGFAYPKSVRFPASSSVEPSKVRRGGQDLIIYKGEEDNGKVIVYFSNAPVGLGHYSDFGTPVKGFEVAGPDKVFHPVKAVVVYDRVEIECPEIADPVAVRYAFHNYCESDLFTTHGVPVPAFRTDSW